MVLAILELFFQCVYFVISRAEFFLGELEFFLEFLELGGAVFVVCVVAFF